MIEYFRIATRFVAIPSGWDAVTIDGVIWRRRFRIHGETWWQLTP